MYSIFSGRSEKMDFFFDSDKLPSTFESPPEPRHEDAQVVGLTLPRVNSQILLFC